MSRLLAWAVLGAGLLVLGGCTGGKATVVDGSAGNGGSTGGGGGGLAGAGSTGSAGATGTAGAAAGGAGGATCTITASGSLSGAIPTVGVVTWSTTLASLTSAEIDFGRSSIGPTEFVAPVDLTQAGYRTLLLGMKGSTGYTYRIVARSGGAFCTSQDYTITTGAVPGSAPQITASVGNAAAHDKGFIVTSSGLVGATSFIVDADGDVVWWATSPGTTSRALMSWDASHMYMMSLNVGNLGTGMIQTVAMDGTDLQTLSGFATSHHDMTSIPGGFATILWNAMGTDAPCSIVERQDATGAITTVEADMGDVYNSATFHTNSIHYCPTDDSYTIGDRNPNLYVKISRQGSLIWQFGGTNPKDPTKFFTNVPVWMVNHGHHWTADGAFLFFNNGANEAWEYQLDASSMTASKTWSYTATGATSTVLGDVQRLPNGNILVTYSTANQIHEVDPSGKLVMKVTGSSFGYSEFRESLYGPPPY